MEYALRLGASYCVHFDADGQHLVSEIAKVLEPVHSGKCDICLGSRLLRPSDRREVPATKRAVLRLARLFHRLTTGLSLSDAHNGLRALNRTAMERIVLHEPRMAHASEILYRIRQSNLRWQEVPVRVLYPVYARKKGQSIGEAVPIGIRFLIRRYLLK